MKIKILISLGLVSASVVYADPILIKNNTLFTIEFGIVQAVGADAELVMPKGGFGTIAEFFGTVPSRGTVSAERPFIQWGTDRYIIVKIVDPKARFVKLGGTLEDLYKGATRFYSLDTIRSTYKKIFAFAPAGYAKGNKFYISLDSDGAIVVSTKPS